MEGEREVPSSNQNEVLLEETVTAREQDASCRLTGGSWCSPYNDIQFTAARALDIGHLVPLTEAGDSGASSWTAKERETYLGGQVPGAATVFLDDQEAGAGQAQRTAPVAQAGHAIAPVTGGVLGPCRGAAIAGGSGSQALAQVTDLPSGVGLELDAEQRRAAVVAEHLVTAAGVRGRARSRPTAERRESTNGGRCCC